MKLKTSIVFASMLLIAASSSAQFYKSAGAGLAAGKGKLPANAEAGSTEP